MSSNSNHINPIITLDNYEEYFILYMDNELSPAQVQMVESFIQQHPHLRIELDMLMDTKLPFESLAFDKTSLLSENMPAGNKEEELLLYTDNELDEDKRKIVQLELQENKSYHQQYLVLLKTKLDPSETIPHPNKKELYRHEVKVISFTMWMRIAAAVILIAAMSALFIMNSNPDTLPPGSVAVQPGNTKPPVKENPILKKIEGPSVENEIAEVKNNEAGMNTTGKPELKITRDENPGQAILASSTKKERRTQGDNLVAVRTELPGQQDVLQDPAETNYGNSVRTASIDISKQSFNNKLVTMDHVDPYNKITASIQPAVQVEYAVENNSKKGSFKTLLRKATRFVEKKTGIDPANGDDELLIGAVALKL